MKLSAALDLYFAEKWDLAQTTVTTYNYHLRHFSSFVGDPEIEDITSDDIRKYLAHIITEIGLSRRTASDHWIC
ncbi:MAG: phage integrase N-terminal SAM-like domain-containing protein [Caldilineaceae bacterium]